MFSKAKIIEILNAEDCYIDDFILDAFIKNWKIDAIYEDENGVNYYDEIALNKVRNGLQGKTLDEKQKEEPKEEQEKQITENSQENITKESEMTQETSEIIPEPVKNEEITEEISVAEKIKNVIEENISTVAENIIEKQQEELQTQEIKETEVIADKDLPTPLQETQSTELKNVSFDISNNALSNIAETLAQKITDEISQYLKNANILEKALKTSEIQKDNDVLTQKINEVINDNRILITKIKELDEENKKYIKIFGNVYIKK